MAKILAFAGSNSSTSINFKLVEYTTLLIEGHEIQKLNLANYPFPMYSADDERDHGFSNSLVEFKNDIANANGLVLAVNEHNGSPSSYFKNVVDWLSRLDRKFLVNTKVLLMAASPGKRGGIGALETIKNMLPHFGGEVVATFSLPSFGENMSENGIEDAALKEAHQQAVDAFLNSL